MSGFIKDHAAAAAFKERLSPFNGNQRDEEKTDIVIEALEPGRRQSATGTGPSLVIYLNFLGLHPPDKKEEDPPPRPIPADQGNSFASMNQSLFDCPKEFNEKFDYYAGVPFYK
jgi:hypothetical protein